MVHVPPYIHLKSTIKPGSVYYFAEETFTSTDPHYFIVVNLEPHTDTVILLVCASSQIQKVADRRRNCPVDTLVHISPGQYQGFRVETVVDCNRVIEKTIEQLAEKLSTRGLKIKTMMEMSLVRRLRSGILLSPLVERRIKATLRD